ncbi:hypothetical protein P0R31_32825 [Bradyrhizobium yuanmingense]|uniref:hypothetical protein n=1 Tax=Bradyrhizobium yuanmingense TaxID=108015 RepID=UPI0023B95768|nr:hypothetical protein [Bradyrhizobium yuanmingense]MDF0522030.1 hypothetical protein [Bradyrhizobium yuanmingense]
MKQGPWLFYLILVAGIQMVGLERPANAQTPGFVSSLLGKPVDWNGSPSDLFSANLNFPTRYPDLSNEPWMRLDPSDPSQRNAYFQAVLAYGLSSFVSDISGACPRTSPEWFHVPWLTFSVGNTSADLAAGKIGSGREPICGLTQERPAPIGFLHAKQTRRVQSWAVGSMNQVGGYLLGRVWRDRSATDISETTFPRGTFVVKFLFTEATTVEVPYLVGAPEWDANVYRVVDGSTRETKRMRLVQIDFSIRDPRFDAQTGWVFGTFMFFNDSGSPPRDWTTKLVPVGLMWGNDPGQTSRPHFREQVLEPSVMALRDQGQVFDLSKRTTFGWLDRVNGPLDNPVSSCLSCHATAQVHKLRIIKHFLTPTLQPGQNTDPNRMLWFRNIPPGTPFTFSATELALIDQGRPSLVREDWTSALMADFVSTDYSLQLRMAIENARFHALQGAPNVLDSLIPPTKERLPTGGARERLFEDFRREAERIERSGELE